MQDKELLLGTGSRFGNQVILLLARVLYFIQHPRNVRGVAFVGQDQGKRGRFA